MSRATFYSLAALMPALTVPSTPIYARGGGIVPADVVQQLETIQRNAGADPNAAIQALVQNLLQFNRSITSATSNLPIRENLEAEVTSLVPTDTPLRNRLRRVPGAGLASAWKVITSYGGGYGASSTTTASGNGATATTITLASVAGFRVGDLVAIGSGATLETRTITAINTGSNTITFSGGLANAQNSSAVVRIESQPGGGSAQRSFFAESGAPANRQTAYGNRTAAYKLMGQMGDVTGLAQAAGQNFQDNLAVEKQNAIMNLMLAEEDALLNGDSTVTAAPWGDGTTALAFDGLTKLIATANGTPSTHIQTAVGQLTLAHIDAQLTRLYYQGARSPWILISGQEAKSLTKLAQASSANYRIIVDQAAANLGLAVKGYIHPITGEVVPVMVDRFVTAGTMYFGADQAPDGKSAIEVEVLPQVNLPSLAPNQNIQGYVAQEIAPSASSPQVYGFIVTCFETLKMKAATCFAISTGVTPA